MRSVMSHLHLGIKNFEVEILELRCHSFFVTRRKLNLEDMSDYNFENKYCIFVFEFLIYFY